MKYLDNFLKENPQLIEKCMNFGITLINVNVLFLNKAMKSILIAKGLNLNYEPNSQLTKDLINAFSAVDKKSYDDDFSWSKLKFNEVSDKLNISKNKFLTLTNLSKIKDPEEQKLLEKRAVDKLATSKLRSKKKSSKKKVS